MSENPLRKLESFGQSVWTDFIRRAIIQSGEFQGLVDQDGVSGVTSNPSIFEKAIAGSHDYDEQIRALALENRNAPDMYQALTVRDIQDTVDILRPMYDRLDGRDGFVSLEVSPHLAHDADGTVAEARRLWQAVDRPNLMIKVPATLEGLPAIRQLIGEGINVNITLLFGLPRYRQVADAYLSGLEDRLAQGLPIEQIASVASFFLSRIDVLVDPMLQSVIDRGTEGGAESGAPQAYLAIDMVGQVAIASAKVAYQIYREIVESDRFVRLAEQGAHPQRLLWASTSTKNPAYSDVKYVEALIGPDTINTMPMETLDAYRDHGDPAPRLEEDVESYQEILDSLPRVGIDLDQVTQQLEDEGIEKFIKPYDLLLKTLEQKRDAILKESVDRQELHLGDYWQDIQEQVEALQQEHFCTRLWHKDPTLWKGDPQQQQEIRNSLGWLHVAEKMEEILEELTSFASEVRQAGFLHVVHLGMGGSSLAPLVFQHSFAVPANGLPLTVLDTTDPATILNVERSIPLRDTLFIIASKSGTTVEARALGDYFFGRLWDAIGDRAGKSFIAITDPGSPLEELAKEQHFRRVFLNFPDIGGRYSALSYFGLVPAALMGLPVDDLLVQALRMVHACTSAVPVDQNPGLRLGAMLGKLTKRGRDKLTLFASWPIATMGMWLEQLLAESTGKEGTGILPVAGEAIAPPSLYRDDRQFAYLQLRGQEDQAQEDGVATLRDAGFPVVTIHLEDAIDLGQEFFRWEFATATAGSILGINAFDQPNVQESKKNTDRLLNTLRSTGHLPEEEPAYHEGPLSFYLSETIPSAPAALGRFLADAHPGDYVAIQAYLTENQAIQQELDVIRLKLRDTLRLATTLGYGPRFLHSTGQYHKGGPNTGLFLQLTADDPEDISVPGQPYTFGMLKRAQALGDLQALREHGRRVARIHLGHDAIQGLQTLQGVLEAALRQMARYAVEGMRPITREKGSY